jgi:hypothetical protein
MNMNGNQIIGPDPPLDKMWNEVNIPEKYLNSLSWILYGCAKSLQAGCSLRRGRRLELI